MVYNFVTRKKKLSDIFPTTVSATWKRRKRIPKQFPKERGNRYLKLAIVGCFQLIFFTGR